MSASTSRLRSMVDEQIGKNATSGDSDSQSSSDTQQLTKEDVQEAVREGVAEALGDRNVDDASTEDAASDEDSSGGRFTLKRLIVFATIATISYLLRRRRRSGNEDSQSDK